MMDIYSETLKRELIPLLKLPNHRSPEDINNIQSLTSNIQFFKKITEEKGSDFIHRQACKYLKLQLYSKGECVIRFGEIAEDFYIILKGKVGVFIPSKVVKIRNTYTEKELEKILIRRVSEHQQRIASEADRVELSIMNLFKQQLSSQLQTLKRADSKLNSKFLKEFGKIEEMKEVSELKEGENFGELALVSNSPRAATIICKDFCILAILNKNEFLRILSKEADRVLEEKAAFLQTLPIFSTTPKSSLLKLSYYFSEKKYHKNQVVYSPGSEVDFVYFVRSGEFKIFKWKMFKSKPIISQGNDSLLRFSNVREIKQGLGMQFSIKAKNEIFGQEEILEKIEVRDYSAVCMSAYGVLYAISKQVMFI